MAGYAERRRYWQPSELKPRKGRATCSRLLSGRKAMLPACITARFLGPLSLRGCVTNPLSLRERVRVRAFPRLPKKIDMAPHTEFRVLLWICHTPSEEGRRGCRCPCWQSARWPGAADVPRRIGSVGRRAHSPQGADPAIRAGTLRWWLAIHWEPLHGHRLALSTRQSRVSRNPGIPCHLQTDICQDSMETGETRRDDCSEASWFLPERPCLA